MLVADMINSCSNEKIAQAAVACIGGEFAERVRRAAREKGSSVGLFTAQAVREFAVRCNEETQAALKAAMTGADQPILSGLRFVVEKALEREGALAKYRDLSLDRSRFDPRAVRGGASFCARVGRVEGAWL